MAYDLQNLKAKYPLTIFLGPNHELTEDELIDYQEKASIFSAKIEIFDFAIYPPETVRPDRWRKCWYTLAMHSQTQYSKLLFLDIDTKVVKNLDRVFEMSSNAFSMGREKNIDHINGGVFLAIPSKKTGKEMKR
eukprot:UN15367